MKKTTIVLTFMLALLMSLLVGCETANNGDVDIVTDKADAVAVFTLDVNPGVRVYVKSDNTVIAVEATNEDGEAIVAEVDFEGIGYEDVVEDIIDKMEEKGFLEGDESAVLISVEKKSIDVSEKLNDRIEKTFEKHGKKASVIEQEIDALDKEVDKTIGDMAKKYNISEGKAHLIDKIRDEFPELSEEELADLKVNDLGMMLEETSDHVKGHFKKIDPPLEKDYVGREQALTIAVESLEIALEDVTREHVFVTRDHGKMVYVVEFVYNGIEYEITVDAESGEVLETESEEYKEFKPGDFIENGNDKNEINDDDKVDLDEIKDQLINDAFGKGENKDERPEDTKDEHKGDHKDEPKDEHNVEQPLSRGEILKLTIAALGISEKDLKKTDVKLHETENGAACLVTLETRNRDRYRVVVEAYSGDVLNVELNGESIKVDGKASE